MKRLLNSSLFWNAVLGSLLGVLAYKVTSNEIIALSVLGMFGLKQAANGTEEVMKKYKGIRYDQESGKEVYIKNDKED